MGLVALQQVVPVRTRRATRVRGPLRARIKVAGRVRAGRRGHRRGARAARWLETAGRPHSRARALSKAQPRAASPWATLSSLANIHVAESSTVTVVRMASSSSRCTTAEACSSCASSPSSMLIPAPAEDHTAAIRVTMPVSANQRCFVGDLVKTRQGAGATPPLPVTPSRCQPLHCYYS